MHYDHLFSLERRDYEAAVAGTSPYSNGTKVTVNSGHIKLCIPTAILTSEVD